MASEFQAGVPAHCPPAEAEAKAGTLFRVCAKNPPDAEDYTAHIRSSNKGKQARAKSALNRDPNDCKPSGLSVWLSESAMRHACKVFKFTEGKFIYKTEVGENDGKVQPTGDNEHHTYWPYSATDLQSRAVFAFGPVNRATVDVA